MAIGKHVSDLANFPAAKLRNFVQAKQPVAMGCSRGLKPVSGGPPGPDKATIAAAPHGSGNVKRRGFADRRPATEMNPTAFGAARPDETGGKCRRYRQRKTRIAYGKASDIMLPPISEPRIL